MNDDDIYEDYYRNYKRNLKIANKGRRTKFAVKLIVGAVISTR